jgi:hypothetical protein
MARSVTPVVEGYPVNETTFADSEGQYGKLHAVRLSFEGDFLARFELSAEERESVARDGQVYVIIHPRGGRVQLISVRCDKPRIVGDEVVWQEAGE